MARWHGDRIRNVEVTSPLGPERVASDKPSGGQVEGASFVHLDDELAAVVAIQPVADAGLKHRSEIRWFQAPARPPLRRVAGGRLVAIGATGESESQADRTRAQGGDTG